MADGLRAYLDANVFIYALEGMEPLAGRCRELLEATTRGTLIGWSSELTLAEVLVRPTRLGDDDLKRAYLALLGPPSAIKLLPVTRSILIESVEYRARARPDGPDPAEDKRNFLPDAIHVVSAIASGASIYVGSDRRIRLPAFLRRVDPRTDEMPAARVP